MRLNTARQCRHFTRFSNHICEAGVVYTTVRTRGTEHALDACFGENEACERYSPYTAEEQSAHKAERKRVAECIQQGISPCCGRAIDTSSVVASGRYEGCGPRYCSQCRKLLFLV